MLQLKFHLRLLPTPLTPHRWHEHKTLFTSPLNFLWNLSVPLSSPWHTPDLCSYYVSPGLSHRFSNWSPSKPFSPCSILSTHRGHFNYKWDHVTPLRKTIQCILMTTKTTQKKLKSWKTRTHFTFSGPLLSWASPVLQELSPDSDPVDSALGSRNAVPPAWSTPPWHHLAHQPLPPLNLRLLFHYWPCLQLSVQGLCSCLDQEDTGTVSFLFTSETQVPKMAPGKLQIFRDLLPNKLAKYIN